MFDIKDEQLENAKKDIARDVDEFEADGTLRGTLSAAEQKKMINTTTSLAECVKASRTNNMNILFLNINQIITFQDTIFIQENVPENLELKRKIWAQIDELVTSDQTIMSTSTSCIVPSKISDSLKRREQFIVAHPVKQKLWHHNHFIFIT